MAARTIVHGYVWEQTAIDSRMKPVNWSLEITEQLLRNYWSNICFSISCTKKSKRKNLSQCVWNIHTFKAVYAGTWEMTPHKTGSLHTGICICEPRDTCMPKNLELLIKARLKKHSSTALQLVICPYIKKYSPADFNARETSITCLALEASWYQWSLAKSCWVVGNMEWQSE